MKCRHLSKNNRCEHPILGRHPYDGWCPDDQINCSGYEPVKLTCKHLLEHNRCGHEVLGQYDAWCVDRPITCGCYEEIEKKSLEKGIINIINMMDDKHDKKIKEKLEEILIMHQKTNTARQRFLATLTTRILAIEEVE